MRQFSPESLRQFRADKGYSKAKLARKMVSLGACTSTTLISQYERGSVMPSALTLPLLADVLEIRIDDMFTEGAAQ